MVIARAVVRAAKSCSKRQKLPSTIGPGLMHVKTKADIFTRNTCIEEPREARGKAH